MFSSSFTLILDPSTFSTVPSREGAKLDGDVCIGSAPTAKLLQEQSEVMKISEAAARYAIFRIDTRDGFLGQPRRVFIATRSSGAVSSSVIPRSYRAL